MTDYYAPGSLSLAFYDLMAALSADHLAGDVAFYAGLAGDPGIDSGGRRRSVLEVGAGTGRVSRALAARGYEVVGLDRSPGMLALGARGRPTTDTGAGGSARFLCADITRFALARRFDLVIAPFYVFNHLDKDPQRRAALGCLREHLAADARLVLHLVPAAILSAELPAAALAAQRTTVRLNGDGLSLQVRVVRRTVDPRRAVCEQQVAYTLAAADGGVLRHSVETLRYAWMTDAQCHRLLDESGLRLVDRRSSFTATATAGAGLEDILVLAA